MTSGNPPVVIHNVGAPVLDIAGQDGLRITGYQPFLTLADSNSGYSRGRIQSADGGFNFYTEASFSTGVPPMVIGNDGKTSVRALQILGGADLTESFEVSGSNPEPGDVVVIDADHSGKLKLCVSSYDRRVAGIISGAGGLQPGLSMGQAGSIANGKHEVALSGRVYCKCDASLGAIEPGDLLTTSETPGHAMKATDHDKTQGAIIGKAMSDLKSGCGLVLVLVSLQ
jgi:hypothetical protein